MTKTQNYNLNQWEASDPICRADFNDSNAAIERALTAQQADIDTRAARTELNAVTDRVTELEGKEYVIGSYTGDGLELVDGGQYIELGFRPRFLIITKGWTTYAFNAASTLVATEHPNDGLTDYYSFEDSGFTVGLCSTKSSALRVNELDRVYAFLAFR